MRRRPAAAAARWSHAEQRKSGHHEEHPRQDGEGAAAALRLRRPGLGPGPGGRRAVPPVTTTSTTVAAGLQDLALIGIGSPGETGCAWRVVEAVDRPGFAGLVASPRTHIGTSTSAHNAMMTA